MADLTVKFTGKIDRRSPKSEGKPEDPIMRENWLARDNILKKPQGTERIIGSTLTDKPTWMGRYYSFETGVISPKTFCYTQDGKLWLIDDAAKTATLVKENLNEDAYPKSWMIKVGTQTYLYLVDGRDLYKFDGNNDNTWNKVTVVDADGNTINPIDLIEHKDRLCLISSAYLYISKNLDFDVFDDATDSIQIIVGSGKGKNKAIGKIEESLFIFTTEGIYALEGDTISALAATFELRFVEDRKIIAGRSLAKVETALVFLADDYNIWSFNGSSSEKLSHSEKLEDFVNEYRTQLDKAVACYYNNYYMLSFVEKGQYFPNLEIWWDAFENKIDFVRGRNVASYMISDPNIETLFMQYGRSDVNYIMWADRNYNFDGSAIVSRLFTRDITPAKGRNVRFTAFYPEMQPIGDKSITFIYLLDGRITDLDNAAYWSQSLKGEVKTLGLLDFSNQNQFTDRVRPKINYARGNSISFYLNDQTNNLRCDFISMTIEFIDKGMKKGKGVGQ